MWRCVSLSSYSQMTYQRWLQVECCQKFKLELSKMTRKDQDSIKHPDSLLKGKWQVFKSIKVVYFSIVVWEDFYDIGTGIDNYFNLQVEWFDYCCNRYSFSILRTIFANVVDNKIGLLVHFLCNTSYNCQIKCCDGWAERTVVNNIHSYGQNMLH